MEKYMEYVFGVRRGSACDLMIAEAVLRNEIGWHWEAEEIAFTRGHQGILAKEKDLVEWSWTLASCAGLMARSRMLA